MLNKFLLAGFASTALYWQNQKQSQCCGIFGVVSDTSKVSSKNNT